MANEESYEPADAPADAADPPAAVAGDTAETAALKRDRDDLYDRLLRKTAEFDNYRKRIDRERREQADQSVTDLLLELLAVVDDFDRALTVDSAENPTAYRKGVELIHSKLHDLLRKRGLRPIGTLTDNLHPKHTH